MANAISEKMMTALSKGIPVIVPKSLNRAPANKADSQANNSPTAITPRDIPISLPDSLTIDFQQSDFSRSMVCRSKKNIPILSNQYWLFEKRYMPKSGMLK